MRIQRKTLIEVGLFVTIGLAIALISVFFIGRDKSLFAKTYTLTAPFEDVSGLRIGAVIQLAGLNVGYVDGVRFPKDKNIKTLEVLLKISRKFKDQIRKDSVATIQTQGLLGDKFILITRGSQTSPALEEGESLETEGVGGIADLTNKGRKMMEEITNTSKTFREALEKISLNSSDKESVKHILKDVEGASADLRAILANIRKGEGTIGALINDPGLYNDMRALMGRANRSKLLKNLIRATISEQDKATQQPLNKSGQ